MRAKARTYDLSFVSPHRKKRTKAKIVFTFKKDHYALLISRLWVMKERGLVESIGYLKFETPFHFPEDNFLSHFGFGLCGSVEEGDGEVRLSVELNSGVHMHYAVLTIHVLTSALSFPLVEGEESNQAQQLDLYTACVMGEVHGHSIGGHIGPAITRFFLQYAEEIPGDEDGVPMPKRVLDAMRQAWRSCAPDSRTAPESFRGQIARDGRFMLACPGNACDIAIYPDTVYGDIEEYGAGLGCHNLDNAIQQLALLAGLASLCQLALEHES